MTYVRMEKDFRIGVRMGKLRISKFPFSKFLTCMIPPVAFLIFNRGPPGVYRPQFENRRSSLY